MVSAFVFFLVPAIAFVFGVRPQQIENRPLTSFPSLARGWGFFTGLSQWATDNLPLRDTAVGAESQLSQGVFGEVPAFSSGGQSASDSGPGPLASPPSTGSTGSTGQSTSQNGGFPQVIAGGNGWLYYGVDIQSKCQPWQPLANTMSDLSRLRSAVEASGRQFVLVVAPDKSTVLPGNLPSNYVGKQCAEQAGEQFWTDVTSSDVGALDLRARLSSTYQLDGVPTYYKLDTHWTNAGALIMLRAVAEQIQPGISATWRVVPASTKTGPSDLPRLEGQSATNNGQLYFVSPNGKLYRNGPDSAAFDDPLTVHEPAVTGMINTPVTIVGDSFLYPTTRYMPALFGDVTEIAYDSMASDPAKVDQTLVGAHVVVFEVVERNLTSGTAPFLQPSVINGISTFLAAHPVR